MAEDRVNREIYSEMKGMLILIFGLVILISLSGCSKPPPQPKNVSAKHVQSNKEGILISWEPNECADSYTIYWSNESGVSKSSGNPITSAISPYLHEVPKMTSTYYYVVIAVRDRHESEESYEVSVVMPPLAPKNIKAELTGGVRQERIFGTNLVRKETTTQDVLVRWNPAEGAESYTIYWSNESAMPRNKRKPIYNATSPYIHKNLTEGNHYFYVITAKYKDSESQESQEVTAKPGHGSVHFKINKDLTLSPTE